MFCLSSRALLAILSFFGVSSFHAVIGSGVLGLRGSGLCLSFVVVVATEIFFFFVVKIFSFTKKHENYFDGNNYDEPSAQK